VEFEFALPEDHAPKFGQGTVVHPGTDAVLFAYGPVMLNEGVKAARLLAERKLSLEVINLPWLNRVDHTWLRETVGKRRNVFTLDNHYVEGGQGQMIAAACAQLGLVARVHCFGVEDIPVSGTNDEVLRHHRLDAASLAEAMAAAWVK
jgi:transketolase